MAKREEIAKKMAENLQELEELSEIEDFVSDNKIEFEYKENKYRVRIPTYRELKMIEEEKIRKQMELMEKVDKDGNPIYLFEEELIEKYKKLGIDIEAMNKNIQLILEKIEDFMLTLAVTKSSIERERLRNQIISLRQEHAMLSMKKADYLSSSIEAQVTEHELIYTLFLIFEKKDKDGNWNKVFETFDDLLDYEDRKLIERGIYFLMTLTENV